MQQKFSLSLQIVVGRRRNQAGQLFAAKMRDKCWQSQCFII